MLAIFQPQGEPLAKNSHTIEESSSCLYNTLGALD